MSTLLERTKTKNKKSRRSDQPCFYSNNNRLKFSKTTFIFFDLKKNLRIGAGEIAHHVNCLPSGHEEPCPVPSNPGMEAHTCSSNVQRKEKEDAWGWLVSQPRFFASSSSVSELVWKCGGWHYWGMTSNYCSMVSMCTYMCTYNSLDCLVFSCPDHIHVLELGCQLQDFFDNLASVSPALWSCYHGVTLFGIDLRPSFPYNFKLFFQNLKCFDKFSCADSFATTSALRKNAFN